MAKIVLTNITKSYGAVRALDNVSLSIESGEFCFLLGPSGCGKSTLLRIIAGFVEADSGSLFFNGKNLAQTPAHKRNIGMMFQNYALWPHMNVAENLSFGLELRKLPGRERKERVIKALQMVHAEELLERLPGQLSGGQQQRVALARALVLEPQVVLLDEPLSNLDAKLRSEMRLEIKRLHAELGLTMIYVTHDQHEALSMADSVSVMRGGKIVQSAPAREIYYKPTSRFVAEFIGEANILEGTVKALGQDVAVDTELGTLISSARYDGLKLGDAVHCCLRPESMIIMESHKLLPNKISGTVIQNNFLGGQERYIVRCNERVNLNVVSSGRRKFGVQHGTEIALGIDSEDLILLPEGKE